MSHDPKFSRLARADCHVLPISTNPQADYRILTGITGYIEPPPECRAFAPRMPRRVRKEPRTCRGLCGNPHNFRYAESGFIPSVGANDSAAFDGDDFGSA